jgi:hypothetical protein
MTRRPVRIMITGSRTWTDRTAIAHAISGCLRSVGTSIGGAGPFPIVVHGGARGADQLADVVARNWGWTPERHPADWDRHGRAAGFRRNAAMVALGADATTRRMIMPASQARQSPRPTAWTDFWNPAGPDRTCRRHGW